MSKQNTVKLIEDAWNPGSMTIEIELGNPSKEVAEVVHRAVRELMDYIRGEDTAVVQYALNARDAVDGKPYYGLETLNRGERPSKDTL